MDMENDFDIFRFSKTDKQKKLGLTRRTMWKFRKFSPTIIFEKLGFHEKNWKWGKIYETFTLCAASPPLIWIRAKFDFALILNLSSSFCKSSSWHWSAGLVDHPGWFFNVLISTKKSPKFIVQHPQKSLVDIPWQLLMFGVGQAILFYFLGNSKVNHFSKCSRRFCKLLICRQIP